MTEELKPCPNALCGSTDIKRMANHECPDFWEYYHQCAICGTVSPARPTLEEAAAAWNTRAPDPRVAELEEAAAMALALLRGENIVEDIAIFSEDEVRDALTAALAATEEPEE